MVRLASLLAATVLLAGCATQRAAVDTYRSEIDSLRVANARLTQDISALRDTLQFYDDIDTGYYYRDRRQLEDRIEKLRYDLSVCADGGQTIETILVDDLFEPGTATLTSGGRSRLDELARTLKEEHANDRIRIEGHADSVPLGPNLQKTYPTNWELSAARATAVVRYFIEEHSFPTGQVEAVAFGATQPVARNDSEAGRRQNRRVRVAVFEQ